MAGVFAVSSSVAEKRGENVMMDMQFGLASMCTVSHWVCLSMCVRDNGHGEELTKTMMMIKSKCVNSAAACQ